MKVIKEDRFNILNEGQQKGISQTCQKYNISRTLYYRWLKRYKTGGIEALSNQRKHLIPVNKISNDMEESILNFIKIYPTYGPRAIKYLIEELGYKISESAVYNCMKRHELTTRASRILYAKIKDKKGTEQLPIWGDTKSGECWLVWVTNYGHHKSCGSVYGVTIFDYISKIACTRIYNNNSFANIIDLLTAVALPVAQTLQLPVKNLCLLSDSDLSGHKGLIPLLHNIIQENGLDMNVHILSSGDITKDIKDKQSRFNQDLLSSLLPHIYEDDTLDELKMKLQDYLRRYNMVEEVHETGGLSPVDYHNTLVKKSVVLPLWAYLYRHY